MNRRPDALIGAEAAHTAAESYRIVLTANGPGEEAVRVLTAVMPALDKYYPEHLAERERLVRLVISCAMPPGAVLVDDLCGTGTPTVVAALVIALGYCSDAIRADMQQEHGEAWRAAAAARYWLGVSVGIGTTLTADAQEHYKRWKNQQNAKRLWAGHAEAIRWAREQYERREPSRWKSKSQFARYVERSVREKFSVQAQATHIRDAWLKGL